MVKNWYTRIILSSLVIVAALIAAYRIFRYHSGCLPIVANLRWQISRDDPNISMVRDGDATLLTGNISLKYEHPYVWGWCDDRMFVIDIARKCRVVNYTGGLSELRKLYLGHAEMEGLQTFYDYRHMLFSDYLLPGL